MYHSNFYLHLWFHSVEFIFSLKGNLSDSFLGRLPESLEMMRANISYLLLQYFICLITIWFGLLVLGQFIIWKLFLHL